MSDEEAELEDVPVTEQQEGTVSEDLEPDPDRVALQQAQALAEDYRQTLQRLKADFDNYRKRVAADQDRWQQMAIAGLVLEVLPAVDNLERALEASGDLAAVRQGVELTMRQLQTALAASGVRPFDALGQAFDPSRHEAVSRGQAPGVPDGHVAEQYRRGYCIKDQVLRPALVKVALPGEPEESKTDGAEPTKEGEGNE